ncbi:MAG: hypothetical protein JXB06_01545 [Spirochaetales bacterium]|nr:hypothetical protein [Spirochaetales bacterium]
MIVTVLVCAFYFLGAASAPSQSSVAWIRHSDSSDNLLIVEMIEQGDLSFALEVASALGLRTDVRIGEIILALGGMVDERPQWEREMILRMLLASVFPADTVEPELAAGLEENGEAIQFLTANLPRFSLSLKREVIRLLGFYHPAGSLSALMAEGRRLSDLLRLQSGDLDGEQAGLALTYLDTIQRIADPDFADIALMLLERSRHLEVAEKARSVSRSLLLER